MQLTVAHRYSQVSQFRRDMGHPALEYPLRQETTRSPLSS